MFNTENVKISLESNGNKYTAEHNWDVGIEELVNSFYTLCVGATFMPITILEAMRDFSEEHLEVYKNE